ncbi:MAG TPA: ATP-binding protein [Trichocoleus sp.]|jgi:hypothetical protein
MNRIREAIELVQTEENFGQKLTIAALSTRTRLTPDTIAKVLDGEQGVDRRTLDSFFRTFNLELNESDYCQADLKQAENPKNTISPSQIQINWGEAPDVSVFYGRTKELQILKQWMLCDRCRLVTVLGMGGSGKSSLVAKLIHQIVQPGELQSATAAFEYVVWRSLRHAPTPEETLTDLIHFLSNQQDTDLPKFLNQLIAQLIQYLTQTPCLLVLDHLETILQPGEPTGAYRQEFAGYGELIQRMGELSHKSCLIVISRERSKEMGLLEGKAYPVRPLLLKGLTQQDGLQILQAEGIDPTEAEAQILVEHYAGNPLALKSAATTTHLLFSGKIDRFLAQGTVAFGSIYDLLDQQFERLSQLEKTVLYWLAIHRKPVSLPELIDVIVPPVSSQKLLGILENLRWRSLIECSPSGFTLQNVVMEYVTSCFVEQIKDELYYGILSLLNNHALVQATATDDIRETQTRLILRPLAEQPIATEEYWATLLQACRNKPHLASGYAPSNLLNLLYHRNQDLSRYAQGVTARSEGKRGNRQRRPTS